MHRLQLNYSIRQPKDSMSEEAAEAQKQDPRIVADPAASAKGRG